MPVDTDSNSWNSASPKTSTKADMLDFLNSNPDQAFTAEEISQEVLDADFEIDIPQEVGQLEDILGKAFASTYHSAYLEAFVRGHLSAAVEEGKVEVRSLSTRSDGEEVDVAHYTISE